MPTSIHELKLQADLQLGEMIAAQTLVTEGIVQRTARLCLSTVYASPVIPQHALNSSQSEHSHMTGSHLKYSLTFLFPGPFVADERSLS